MSDIGTTGTSFDECADALSEFIASLRTFSPTVLAFALRVHLSELLRALRAHGLWSATELAAFLEEMSNDINE